jgi:hypothetical protein
VSLSRRIGKLEAARKPIVRVPHVIRVSRCETTDEARAGFAKSHPDIPCGHRVLIVPCRDRTPEDDADFATKFKEQQSKLIAIARSRT